MPIKYSTRNRETGTTIDLYDKNASSIDVPASLKYRWVVNCQQHASYISYDKQTAAYKAMTQPSEWCPSCKLMKDNDEKVETTSPSKSVQRRLAAQTATKPPEGYEQPPGKMPEDMTHQELMAANICYNLCGHPLHAQDGHFHTTGFPVNNICCFCAKHDTTKSEEEINIG